MPGFNYVVCYTPPPVVPASWINWRSSRVLKPREALAANEALAVILDRVERDLAERVRSCGPRYRCGKWRYCAFCGPLREASLVRKYRDRLLLPAELAHVTLTTRSIGRLTRRALKDLATRYNLLRRQKRFKRAVGGALVNIQVEYGAAGWLVHMHIVVDHRGGLSKAWLRKAWGELGDGSQADFEIIKPETQHQVLAYGARRPDLPLNSQLVFQFFMATRGFTLIRPSGTFNKLTGRRRGQEVGPGRGSLR